jgi:transcriptional regulator with XRE-family HTH domain
MQAFNYHNLCVEESQGEWHPVTMMKTDKNDGPNHLRAWREFRGMTQAALAEKVDTNANMIQYLETGERALSAKWLRRLAPTLDTTPGMLLDHDPTELDTNIIDIWASASSRERKQITEIARTLRRTGTDGE